MEDKVENLVWIRLATRRFDIELSVATPIEKGGID